jgi:hypothetical protein
MFDADYALKYIYFLNNKMAARLKKFQLIFVLHDFIWAYLNSTLSIIIKTSTRF